MKKRSRNSWWLLLSIIGLLSAGCMPLAPSAPEPETGKAAAEASGENAYTGPITEIAIRRLNAGQELDAFAEARDSFVAQLKEQSGVGADREFAAFLDLSAFATPEPAVFVGMTEYETIDAFTAAGQALGESAAAGAFFSTFTPEVFTALRPLNAYDRYEPASIAREPGQVLEIAARDLSLYENFDQADYSAKRESFLKALSQQAGFVAEYQWVSVLDPNIAIGMTVYASAEAFQAIATSAFVQSAEYTNMLSAYPPIAGYVSIDARAEEATMYENDHTIFPVMEIAIRQVKAGQEEAFVTARAAFIRELKAQDGVERDWEFQSFFTMPEPNATDVFVGMTRYASLDVVTQISEKLMNTEGAQNFFGTFDMQAFVLVQPADGTLFKLEDVINQPGQVLEVAARTPKAGMEEQFQPLRNAFFAQVAAQPGYIMDKEFIDLQSGANVVLIAWETVEDFQNALGVLPAQPEMGAFFDALDVQAYQALTLTTNQ